MSNFKKFPGLYPRTPGLKGRGRIQDTERGEEGKKKGGREGERGGKGKE
jgi:hypothetical protein